jgi:hypothetical protein
MCAHCGYTLLWSLELLPTLLAPNPIFQQLSIHIFISLPSEILCFTVSLMLSHSLFLSLFPWLTQKSSTIQTCSAYEFVYNHVWFCVYVYLLDLSLTYVRKYVTFAFLSLAYFT